MLFQADRGLRHIFWDGILMARGDEMRLVATTRGFVSFASVDHCTVSVGSWVLSPRRRREANRLVYQEEKLCRTSESGKKDASFLVTWCALVSTSMSQLSRWLNRRHHSWGRKMFSPKNMFASLLCFQRPSSSPSDNSDSC